MSAVRLRKFRLLAIAAAVAFLLLTLLGGWIGWGSWPGAPPQALPWTPDAIVVLGGGNSARSSEAARLATAFPEVMLIVTGDGGTLHRELLDAGIPASRLIHETAATSTVENARFTRPLLDDLSADRVVLVTNWFHVPRSLAVFDRWQPEREFAVACEPRPEPLNSWDIYCARRERLAAIHHLFRHGIWSFR